jgi:hypothetical protein
VSQGLETSAQGQGTVGELIRRAGAEALVGLELYLKEGRIGARRRVRLEKLNSDGRSYKVMDIREKVGLVRDFRSGEMSVGLGTRSEDEAVVKLMRHVKMDPKPFLETHLDRPASAVGDHRTPPSRLEAYEPYRRSAPPFLQGHASGGLGRPTNPGVFRAETPSPRREPMHAERGPFSPMGGRWFGPFRPNPPAAAPFPVIPPRPGGRIIGEQMGRMGGQMNCEGWGPTAQNLMRELHAERVPEQREFLNGTPWEPRRAEADWPQRTERNEPSGRRAGPFDSQPGGERDFQRIREGVPRGQTWVRNDEDEERWDAKNEWDLRGEEQRIRGAAERRGGIRRNEEEVGERERREYGGREDEGWREWEPKGRNELRAIRQNEKDKRPRYQEPDEEGSEVEDSQRKGECKISKTSEGRGEQAGVSDRSNRKDRRYAKARSGLRTELCRLQSGVSAFNHPGLSHIDQMVTLHEAPVSHRGPMAVAGATGDILKVPHIKLSYLADSVWEFTWRKCAEAGKHLTDQQILEIEAQVMEYFGKQRVEAGKILDKAGLSGRGR